MPHVSHQRLTALAAVALCLAMGSGACSTQLPIPDEDDSVAVLTEAYEAALLGDEDALCALASSSYNCEQSLIGVPRGPDHPSHRRLHMGV